MTVRMFFEGVASLLFMVGMGASALLVIAVVVGAIGAAGLTISDWLAERKRRAKTTRYPDSGG